MPTPSKYFGAVFSNLFATQNKTNVQTINTPVDIHIGVSDFPRHCIAGK